MLPLLLLLLLIHHLVYSTCAYICAVHLCWNSSREKLLEIKLPSNDLSPWAGTPFHLKDRISFLRMASSSAFCMDVTKMDSYLHYRPKQRARKKTTVETIITHIVRQCDRNCVYHTFFPMNSFSFPIQIISPYRFFRLLSFGSNYTIQTEMNNDEWHYNYKHTDEILLHR